MALLTNKHYLYLLVTDFVLNKVPQGLTLKKFQKKFKNTAERLLLKLSKRFLCSFLLKNGLTKNSLFVVTRRWVGHQSCYSSKVLPRVVNIETAASEITKKELVQSQIAEHHCMSFYGIFQTFCVYYYCLHSSFP